MTNNNDSETSDNSWFGTETIPARYAVLLLFVAGGVFYFYAWPWVYWTWFHPDDLPGIQSHWHTPYAIKICGMDHPPLPRSEGDVHTHGDGQIHVHPSGPSTAGKKANLSAFFESVGGTITETRLALPPLLDVVNGEECKNGGKAELSVYVNGEPIEDFPSYVPEEGDEVLIYFGEPLPSMSTPEFPTHPATSSDTTP